MIVGKSTFTREMYNGGPWDDPGRVSLRQGRLTHILLCSLKTRSFLRKFLSQTNPLVPRTLQEGIKTLDCGTGDVACLDA